MGPRKIAVRKTGASELALGESIFDKTVVGKSAADAAPEANVADEANAEQAVRTRRRKLLLLRRTLRDGWQRTLS